VRIPLERLAWLITQEPENSTLGELAHKFNEPVRRIADAIDADKMRRGKVTTMPPVDWSQDPVPPG
jgi:hypothetical protein